MAMATCQCLFTLRGCFSAVSCMQEERSRGEHNLTNITKTQERVQAEKGGKASRFLLSFYTFSIFIHFYLQPVQKIEKKNSQSARFRKRRTFEPCRTKTNRFYNSFIPYSIRNFQ